MVKVVDISCAEIRLDIFVQNMAGVTRSRAQKLVAAGDVLVNGMAAKANYRLRDGDSIELRLPKPEETDVLPENIPLNIIYEDDDLIVVDKNKGMVVHPAAGHFSGTLVNALLFHCGGNLSKINGGLRPGIVHRLDKDTSGLLVAAKNDITHNALAEQFAAVKAAREYMAIVHGRVKNAEGVIDKPIARHKTNRKKMAVNPEGRTAVTFYNVEENFNKFTLIKAKLQTGRTHQIRVHMAYLNHPVLGDAVYGPSKQPFGLDSQVLHSRLLGFVHPATKKHVEFESPLPMYFEEVLKKIRKSPTD